MVFEDRQEAGRLLARLVATEQGLEDAVVLGLARGGVPVAYEIARACQLSLDVLVVRKLGVPGTEELAMGAIAGGKVVLNPDVLKEFKVSEEMLEHVLQRERAELERREMVYRKDRPAAPIDGRAVILVDDGLATGATMRAAVQAVNGRARRVVVAIPVGTRGTCRQLEHKGVRVLCSHMPEDFHAVGIYYRDFRPTSDHEVRILLHKAQQVTDSAAKGNTDRSPIS